MTHVLPFVSAQNCDKNALQNRRGRPVLNKFGSLTIVFSVLSFSQNLPMYSIFAAQYLQKYFKHITMNVGSLIANSLICCMKLFLMQHTCPELLYQQNYNYGPEFMCII